MIHFAQFVHNWWLRLSNVECSDKVIWLLPCTHILNVGVGPQIIYFIGCHIGLSRQHSMTDVILGWSCSWIQWPHWDTHHGSHGMNLPHATVCGRFHDIECLLLIYRPDISRWHLATHCKIVWVLCKNSCPLVLYVSSLIQEGIVQVATFMYYQPLSYSHAHLHMVFLITRAQKAAYPGRAVSLNHDPCRLQMKTWETCS